MIKFRPRKNCIVCENKINRSSNKGGLKTRRKLGDITCSRQCSKIYTRVYNRILPKFKVLNDSSESPKDELK